MKILKHIELLNKNQREAVITTEGPLLIISGAGSGKTKTLVEKVIYLLVEKKVAPESIFISTFTEKATRELITRISERLKDENKKVNINDMYIGTLHSIFLRLIDENIEYSHFQEGYRVLDDIDQIFFIFSKIKKFAEIDGYKEFFRDIPALNSWERSKKILQWLNKINEEGKRLDYIKTENKKINFLKEAHRVYHELLVEDNVIDFTTIQRELYRILYNNSNVLEKLREKISYIMIDEYQDTNSIQEKIIFLLGEPKENICVVGDDDQGIYRFRGASIKNILQFTQRFEPKKCKIITLDINYRSHKDIIKFCDRWINLINWKEFRYSKNILPPENKEFFESSAVVRIGGNSERNWKENIYQFIKKLYSTKKIEDLSQVAFLFRSVQTPNVKNLKKYLEESGIPVYSPRSKDFFEREEIKLVIASLLVYFPHSKYIVLDEVQNRGNIVFHYYKDALALLKNRIREDEELYKWLVEKRKENAQENKEEFLSLKEIFYSLFQFKTFKERLNLEDDRIEEKRSAYNLGVFSEVLEKFEILTKTDRIFKENIEKVIRYFFMVYLKQLILKKIDEYEDKEDFPKGAIPFLTFHQAKGLEFPVVIVGSLDSVPIEKERTEEDILEEILRLEDDFEPRERKYIFDFWRIYYTAFSRAQDLLILTSIENRSGRNELPSRTFRPVYESIPYVNDEKFHLEKVIISPVKRIENKEVFSYTGHILLYEFCPLKYRFIKEFKFKQLKKVETYYGIFIHKVLEKIHRESLEGFDKNYILENLAENIKTIGDILEKSLRTKFCFEDRERVKKETEKYVQENSLDGLIGCEIKNYNVEEDYILEGTLDILKKSQTGVELIDFKSGIYDEKKYRSYKRQLEIYTYLLKNKYSLDEIKAFLYYTDTGEYKEVELEEKNIENTVKWFSGEAKKILQGIFKSRTYDEKCISCEFRWYCQDKYKDIEEEL